MTTPVQGKNGRFLRTIDSVERDAEAARLRAEGHGYAQIAARLGYNDASGAWRAVQRAYQQAGQEYGQAARELELDRIDRLLQKAFGVLDDPGPLVDRLGRAVVDPATGEARPDQMIVLNALDRATRLLERRARVLGTDSPKKSMNVNMSIKQHQEQIRQLAVDKYGYDPHSEEAHQAWQAWLENDEPLVLGGSEWFPRLSECSEGIRGQVTELRRQAATEFRLKQVTGLAHGLEDDDYA